MPMSIQELSDRLEIQDLMTRYSTRSTFMIGDALNEVSIQDRRDAHPATSSSSTSPAPPASARALQLAFRRHLDTTPMSYLRRVRLDRAHRDLINANPPDGVPVTTIAARWGYTPSRFAAYCRATYGQPPSHTLHDGEIPPVAGKRDQSSGVEEGGAST